MLDAQPPDAAAESAEPPEPARFTPAVPQPAAKPPRTPPLPAQIAAGPPGVPTDWILPKVEEVLEPSVKVSRILALQNDLSLALAASPIRILAPVPGRPFVGIEIPNAATTLVGLSGVVMSESFSKIAKKGGLPIALGRDTTGKPVAGDLATMPHLLIAGATGSGKSVAINVLISSLLLTHTPDTLKLLLVDPKRVELTPFRGLPHLAAPVVVEVERVVGVLQWAVREMDRRYRMFAEEGARNIAGHNARVMEKNGRPAAAKGEPARPPEPILPYIVIVIDELADLMMVAPEEAEKLITRLAQLARATGIHLVLATQRPSVDVVTGLIKANFPSRIAFAVSSSIDSRVILDTVGAEKLLGRGDMLYLASDASKLQRLQGCYVADDEIERLTRHWRRFAKLEPAGGAADIALTLGVPEPLIQKALWDQMVDPQTGTLAEERDHLFDEAVETVRKYRTASTSFLQRKLRVGYARAGRLMDELEEAGVVGPVHGNNPREVLIGDDDAVAPNFETALEASFDDDGHGRPAGLDGYPAHAPDEDEEHGRPGVGAA
jgi:S-DNA-T family DNA segregation ATPase FtsK/SpoIIIE